MTRATFGRHGEVESIAERYGRSGLNHNSHHLLETGDLCQHEKDPTVVRTTAENPVTATPPLATGMAWDTEAPGHSKFSVDRYTDQSWLDRELEQMWPRAWQIACSVDHLANPGDWHEHRFGATSILIVHGNDGQLRAFQNVCRHRGNLLCQGTGEGLTELRCQFHRWAWGLEGELREVPSRRAFGALRNEDFPLLPASVDSWGPLVFVNTDPDAEPLQEWLEGIPDDIEWARIEEFHCGVTTTTPVSCNWKVVSEGFSESYHVQGLHPEMTGSVDDLHAAQYFWDRHAVSYQLYGISSPRYPGLTDQEIWDSFNVTQGGRAGLPVDQTRPMPDLADDETAFDALSRSIRDHNHDRGVDLDEFDDDQIMRIRQYNLFPNASVLITADSINVLVSRPTTIVDKAELFTMHLQRHPSTATSFKRPTDVTNSLDAERLGLVFNQDIRAMSLVQRGMAQPGFTETVVSSEERRIINTHRVLATYLDD